VGLCDDCSDAAWDPREITVAGALPVRAACVYAGTLAHAVRGMKRGERAYLDSLGMLVGQLVPASAVLVPAVTLRRRAAERGFDQARELAHRAAALSGATVADVLVKRGRAQRGLGRAARLAARGRFRLRPGVPVPSRALLLDDVVTTGATLADAAAVLRAAGCFVTGAVVVAARIGETSGPAAESRRR
jgi:predicted amidophosphoribosyltransferase